jgi:hypothetical protein
MIKDSGERTQFTTGAVRDMHDGKGRMDLLPWAAIMEVSKHCEAGAKKYGEHNVDKGIPTSSLCDSAMRHLAKYLDGWTDENHLVAATWNLLWALEMEKKHPECVNTPWRAEGANEKRLIDANVVRQKLQEIIDETQNWRNKKASKIDPWRYVDEIYKLDNWLGVYAECVDLIDEAPTVDAVEVVHGRWEKAEYYGYMLCDKCKDVYIEECYLGNGKWNYCPNCGAKMDGGNEDG